jgi:prepilin-type processing-associated H-X9-DG protein
LAALILPALNKAREWAEAITCLNNTHQLALTWLLYADDNYGSLPYNLALSGTYRTNLNWANNVMTRDLSSDNTNTATLTEASLGPYFGPNTHIFQCPSDWSLSTIQMAAGWSHRIRSYTMNGMVGNVGQNTAGGGNLNNPGYEQFSKIMQISRPGDLFVFLDEHPDSIRYGYFLDKASKSQATPAVYPTGSTAGPQSWNDLPASYHNKNSALSFADGHAEFHRWVNPETVQPIQPNVLYCPVAVTSSGEDFQWVVSHMSIPTTTVGPTTANPDPNPSY